VTVKQFAERAEISLSLAYQLIAEGRVPHRRMGSSGHRGSIRVTEEDFREFMESTKVQEVQ
jgi:excisionase family DNA binding protein